VPVIDDGQGFVYESSGIVLHIADLHPELGLAPTPGTHERALAYQWIFLAMTEIEPALVDLIRAGDADPARATAARERAHAGAAVVDRALEGREYLVGDRFGVADIVAGSVLGFGRRYGAVDGLPNVAAYVDRLDARPARRRADTVGAA
jgi:glutathione S-transferase